MRLQGISRALQRIFTIIEELKGKPIYNNRPRIVLILKLMLTTRRHT